MYVCVCCHSWAIVTVNDQKYLLLQPELSTYRPQAGSKFFQRYAIVQTHTTIKVTQIHDHYYTLISPLKRNKGLRKMKHHTLQVWNEKFGTRNKIEPLWGHQTLINDSNVLIPELVGDTLVSNKNTIYSVCLEYAWGIGLYMCVYRRESHLCICTSFFTKDSTGNFKYDAA